MKLLRLPVALRGHAKGLSLLRPLGTASGLIAILLQLSVFAPAARAAAALRVSDNGRFLVRADGSQFFFMADTAWEMFHQLTDAEMDAYLQDRANRKFNLVLAVATSASGPLDRTNAYGQSAFISNNIGNPNPAFFAHVDHAVAKAAALGMFIGLLPCWGGNVADSGAAINVGNAEAYGRFLGARYANQPIIWVLGGDRSASSNTLPTWRAMARGIAKGVSGGVEDYSQTLMTYHSNGDSWAYRGEVWLDFHGLQSGHGQAFTPSYQTISILYALTPPKPVVDLEANYEDHPINWIEANGRFNALSVRRQGYWGTFAGALGYTYGATGVFQFFKPGNLPSYGSRSYWYDALAFAGANQMRHLRAVLESRPLLTSVPDQTLITSSPLSGGDYLVARRDGSGSFGMVYSPGGKPFTVNLARISGSSVRAWWFNPRDGSHTNLGTYPNSGTNTFAPPNTNDWVLVLDDVLKNFAAPGQLIGPLTLGPLHIRVASNNVTIFWPTGDGLAVLETAPSLGSIGVPPTWSSAGGITNPEGTNTAVTRPAPEPARYFRLRKP